MSAPLLYAFTLGMIAAVNPCGFPLLPAYLALFLGRTDGSGMRSRTIVALVAGSCVTVGFVVAFGGIGILVQLGMLALAPWTLWLTAGFGAALVALGILGLTGHAPTFGVRTPAFAPGRSAMAMTGFGLAYALSSLSCALPLFLAAVSNSFGRYGLLDGLAVFLSYALGMGVFVTGASIVAAHLGIGSIQRLRPITRFVPALANVLLLIVGVYMATTASLGLADPLSTPPIISDIDAVQNAVSEWLASSALIIGSVLLAIVLAAIAVVAGTGRRARNLEEENV